MEVVLMLAEMVRQTVDPLREEGDLHFGRTSIIRVGAKLGNDRLFLLCKERHTWRTLSETNRLQTHENYAR